MGEGLFSPWHIAIIAFVVFMVFGPKKLADRFTDISQGMHSWMDGEGEGGPSGGGSGEAEVVAAPPPKKPSLARRFGQWLHRRRERKRRAASR